MSMEQMLEFSEAEIDILLSGVDKWASDAVSGIMGGMLEMMLPDEVRKSDKFVAEKAERDAKEKREKQLREEQAIMLKAKLVQFKQKVAVSELAKIS